MVAGNAMFTVYMLVHVYMPTATACTCINSLVMNISTCLLPRPSIAALKGAGLKCHIIAVYNLKSEIL